MNTLLPVGISTCVRDGTNPNSFLGATDDHMVRMDVSMALSLPTTASNATGRQSNNDRADD
jgi:hypothetical protein